MPGWLHILLHMVLSIFYAHTHTQTHTLTSTASSIYLEVWSIFTRVQSPCTIGWHGASGGYLPTTSPLRLQVLRDSAQSDRLYYSSRRHTRTYNFTYLLQKTTNSKIFWALSEGSRGSKPTSSDSSPRATYPGIFSRLSTSILTEDFTQALPTSNVIPTPTPYSDSTPRVTYLRIFSRLSTSILRNLTNGFTQALPTTTVTPTPYLHGLHTLKCVTIVDHILLWVQKTNCNFVYIRVDVNKISVLATGFKYSCSTCFKNNFLFYVFQKSK